MALMTCKLCEKIFTSAGGRTCPECLKQLDELYPVVRQHLRDNPKEAFNVDTLATELDIDIRKIQALVDMGYLERDAHRIGSSEEREKLAKEFEDSLKQMKSTATTSKNAAKTYGMQRYGR